MTSEERAVLALKAMVVGGARISWEEPHARARAAERDVPIFVAERIVRAVTRLRVTRSTNGSETWRLSGRDADDRPIDVVVFAAPHNVIRVVTVIRTDE